MHVLCTHGERNIPLAQLYNIIVIHGQALCVVFQLQKVWIIYICMFANANMTLQ